MLILVGKVVTVADFSLYRDEAFTEQGRPPPVKTAGSKFTGSWGAAIFPTVATANVGRQMLKRRGVAAGVGPCMKRRFENANKNK